MVEGKKLDGGKSPLLRGVFAYFPNALAAVGNVSAYGAQKYNLDYADKNWARVEGGLGRYGDALARHTTRHAAGESHDPESHLLHVAHAAWNALAVLELVLATEPLVEVPPPIAAPPTMFPVAHSENCGCWQCLAGTQPCRF